MKSNLTGNKFTVLLYIFTMCILTMMSSFGHAEESELSWKKFDFIYEKKSYSVSIPEGMKPNEAIRAAIIVKGEGMNEFAHKNRVAYFNKFDERGPTVKFLKEAAIATGRKELEHAGFILQGLSKEGRTAARWGAAHGDVPFLVETRCGLTD